MIAWFRAAEIKHGRVAMAAFVGFIVGENKIHFPWALQGGPDGLTYEALANVGGACAQWDAVPTLGKLQILGAVGLLEIWSECSGTHYMAPGGKPGCVAPSAPHSEKRAHRIVPSGAVGSECTKTLATYRLVVPSSPSDVSRRK